MKPFRYRPEIDGLRAIAILLVILHHGKFGFSGGYVGVDVFFVISGFLITSIIIKDFQNGSFSIVRFWERRVRRILPAMVVMCLVTAAFSYFLLLPFHFDDFGKSLVATATSLSNIYFYLTSGYFEARSELKPLLHTWSLAVEEQFYLLFPLLLFGLLKSRSASRDVQPADDAETSQRLNCGEFVIPLAIVAVLSFAMSVWAVSNRPTAAFFLLPSRAWELMIGALLALRPPAFANRFLSEACASGGLLMILGSALFYSAATPFPGLAALVPCAGAAMFIAAGNPERTVAGMLLATRPLVFVGLISYSLYLWHWPALVLTRYWQVREESILFDLLAIAGAFCLAFVTWKWVELPFRDKRILPGRSLIFATAAASVAVLVAFGLAVYRTDGMPGRMPVAAVRFQDAYVDRAGQKGSDLSLTTLLEHGPSVLHQGAEGADRFLLWGDSHARVLSDVFEEVCRSHNATAFRACRSATPPLFLMEDPVKNQYNAAVIEWIERLQITDVVLVAMWQGCLVVERDQEGLRAVISALRTTGARVWIVRQVPMPGYDVPRELARAVVLGDPIDAVGLTLAAHEAKLAKANRIIDLVVQPSENVAILDPLPWLQNGSGFFPGQVDGACLYYDGHHLTRTGASHLKPLFERLFPSGLSKDLLGNPDAGERLAQ